MDEPIKNPVKVTINFSFKDAFIASMTLRRFQPISLIATALFPLAGLAILPLSWIVKHQVEFNDVFIAVMCLLFVPLITCFSIWSARRRNKLAQGPFHYTFDDSGMKIEGATFDATIKWAAIPKARETKRFLLVFISPNRAHCLSLVAMKEQGVLNEVRSIVTQHTKFH